MIDCDASWLHDFLDDLSDTTDLLLLALLLLSIELSNFEDMRESTSFMVSCSKFILVFLVNCIEAALDTSKESF